MYPIFTHYVDINPSKSSCYIHAMTRSALMIADTIGPIALLLIGALSLSGVININLSTSACYAFVGVGAGFGLLSVISWTTFAIHSARNPKKDYTEDWKKCCFNNNANYEGVFDKIKMHKPPPNTAFLLFTANGKPDLFFEDAGAFTPFQNAIETFPKIHLVIFCENKEAEKRWVQFPKGLDTLICDQHFIKQIINKTVITALSLQETRQFSAYAQGLRPDVPLKFKKALGLKIKISDFL